MMAAGMGMGGPGGGGGELCGKERSSVDGGGGGVVGGMVGGMSAAMSQAREMGVAACQVVRLRPRLVAIAAVEQGKLRALMRNLSVQTSGA